MRQAGDASAILRTLSDDETIQALAHASHEHDPYLANVLATEAMNRMRRSRIILRHLGEGVVAFDREERITDMNRAARRLLGYERAEILGRPFHETIHSRRPDGAEFPREACPMLAVLQDPRERASDDDVFVRKDGTLLPVSYTVAAVLAQDDITGAVVAFRDASERKAQEAERARSHFLEETFYDVHDRLGIGLVIVDDMKLTHANAAFCSLVGRDLAELNSQSNLMINVWPDDRTDVVDHFTRVVEGSVPNVSHRTRLLHRDGSAVAVEVMIGVAPSPLGSGSRLVCVVLPLIKDLGRGLRS